MGPATRLEPKSKVDKRSVSIFNILTFKAAHSIINKSFHFPGRRSATSSSNTNSSTPLERSFQPSTEVYSSKRTQSEINLESDGNSISQNQIKHAMKRPKKSLDNIGFILFERLNVEQSINILQTSASQQGLVVKTVFENTSSGKQYAIHSYRYCYLYFLF